MSLFFSLDGRIGRGKYWLALVVLLVSSIPLSFALAEVASQEESELIVWILYLYPLICVYKKRLQDRGRMPLPWMVLFIAPILFYSVAKYLGLGFQPVELETGEFVTQPTGFGLAVVFFPLIFNIWAAIECGMLRGTRGDNQFGPDPSATRQQQGGEESNPAA